MRCSCVFWQVREEILPMGNVHVWRFGVYTSCEKAAPPRVTEATGSLFLVVNKNLGLILLFGLNR